MLSSGSLANVRQIGIEFHYVPQYGKQYFTIVQELYKLGFVTIMWDENRIFSALNRNLEQNLNRKLNALTGAPLFEIVFRRSTLATCFLWNKIYICEICEIKYIYTRVWLVGLCVRFVLWDDVPWLAVRTVRCPYLCPMSQMSLGSFVTMRCLYVLVGKRNRFLAETEIRPLGNAGILAEPKFRPKHFFGQNSLFWPKQPLSAKKYCFLHLIFGN